MNRKTWGGASAAVSILALSGLCAVAHADPDLDVNVNTTLTSGSYATIKISPNGSTTPPVTLDFGGTAYANVMELYNNGVANIGPDASIDALVGLDHSRINFSGGTVNYQADVHNLGSLFVTGGVINGGIGLSDYSFLSLEGGTIKGDISPADYSTADMFGGTVTGDVLISQSAVFTLHGGAVNGKVTATDHSLATIYGGKADGNLYALSDSFLLFASLPNTFSATPNGTWSDGIIYDITFKDAYSNPQNFVLYDDDTLNPGKNFAPYDIQAVPEPGAVAFGLVAAGGVLGLALRRRRAIRNVLAVSAALLAICAVRADAQTTSYNNDGDIIGAIAGNAIVGDAPVNPPITVFTNAGTLVVGTVAVKTDSTLEMRGGVVAELEARDDSVVNYRGGTAGDLFAFDRGRLNIIGYGLAANLVDPNFGPYSQYVLAGFVTDGVDLAGKNLYIENGSDATFNLVNVPEPSAIAFGVISAGGVLGMVARKRKA